MRFYFGQNYSVKHVSDTNSTEHDMKEIIDLLGIEVINPADLPTPAFIKNTEFRLPFDLWLPSSFEQVNMS